MNGSTAMLSGTERRDNVGFLAQYRKQLGHPYCIQHQEGPETKAKGVVWLKEEQHVPFLKDLLHSILGQRTLLRQPNELVPASPL
jgi:hypothetical protein